MPSVTIVKVKIRRGTNDQRKDIILEEGELGYTTDTKRLFIGDGVTNGGLAVAPQVYTPLSKTFSITGVAASVGEIVPAGSLIYQLTSSDYSSLSSWVNISTKPDNVTLEYTGTDNKVLSIKSNTVGSNSFNSTAAYEFGGITATTSNGLSANVDGTYVLLSSNKITISPISADKISSSAIGDGLVGGNGNKLNLNIGPSFAFDNTTKFLKLTSLPSKIATLDSIDTTTIYGDGITLDNNDKLILDKNNILGSGLILDPSNKIALDGDTLTIPGSGISFLSEQGLYINFPPVIGNNLSINGVTGKLQADIPVTDNSSLITVGNEFQIADITIAADAGGFTGISYNSKGQIVDTFETIIDTLTASSSTNSYLSVFNGCPNQVTSNYGYKNQTLINVTSAFNNGVGISTATIKLTSAGFITFNSADTDKDISTVGRFAIPVFTY
jgi:hypothetical protein